jgi:hypothetical protein
VSGVPVQVERLCKGLCGRAISAATAADDQAVRQEADVRRDSVELRLEGAPAIRWVEKCSAATGSYSMWTAAVPELLEAIERPLHLPVIEYLDNARLRVVEG